MKIGDKVRFLNEVGGGIVTGFVGKILVDYAQYEGKLTDQEANCSQRQVDDVATRRYDHIIERAAEQGMSR